MSHDLSNYEEVPDRIVRFFADHPEGSLRCEKLEFTELPAAHKNGEPSMHIIYHALAYRSPDDRRPGQGKASEPLPGLTQFTKGSELMNAETSAWGRALAAIGYVGKKVASANEVRNRSAEQEEGSTSRRQKDGSPKPSAAQRNLIEKLRGQKKLLDAQVIQMVGEITLTEGVNLDEGWVDRYLTGGKDGSASALIDRLMKGPIPEATVTEVPTSDTGDGAEFEHKPAEGDEKLPWDKESAAA